jgi:GntR family transcriptional regulator
MAHQAEIHLRTIALDKSSSKPIYVQIAEGVGALLERQVYPAGFVLPAERWFCEQYGVSRMTLRQAMGILDRKGLIESHRGRGTFVAPRRIQKQQQELRSFSEEICLRGGKPMSRVLSFEAIFPATEARDFFGLADKQKVYEIKRLRLKDGAPLALETALVPEKLAPWLDRFDLAKNSLYRILEESYGLKLETSIEEMSAAMPSAAQRKLLELPSGAAVLVVHRKTFTDQAQPIELTQSVYRADLYSAVVHSIRKAK